MKSFADLPDQTRFQALKDLDGIKGECAGYLSHGVCVAVPRDGIQATIEWAKKYGMSPENSGYFFPLGTDNPPEHLRWDGPSYYERGNRGFFLYMTFSFPEVKQ